MPARITRNGSAEGWESSRDPNSRFRFRGVQGGALQATPEGISRYGRRSAFFGLGRGRPEDRRTFARAPRRWSVGAARRSWQAKKIAPEPAGRRRAPFCNAILLNLDLSRGLEGRFAQARRRF